MELKNLQIYVKSITIFRNILHTEPMQKLLKLMEEYNERRNSASLIDSYSDFLHSLYKYDTDFGRYLLNAVLTDENVYTRLIQSKKEVPESISDSLLYELEIFEFLSQLSNIKLDNDFISRYKLPQLISTRYDFRKEYLKSIKNAAANGFGIYAQYHTFTYKNNEIIPIKNHDPITLEELTGYQREREMVIKNTLAFIRGKKANNTLLYGDAGTGKSSTIKAIVNKYHDQGLRLIEIKKQHIEELDEIIELLTNNPLKFIIFIDDLSFESNNESFITLKNILEGGIVSNRKNIIVYATSNRRHLVKENMKDRDGDELFVNDSIQETLSLAARFGLTITFSKPLKKLYLEIVRNLAEDYNLEIDDEFYVRAEAFALRNNGRSPRTAKQFVEFESIKGIKL